MTSARDRHRSRQEARQAPPAKAKEFARLKHIWLEQIMLDPNLTFSNKVVGYGIFKHLNNDEGCAWPSEELLATELGMDVKTVKLGVAALQGKPKKHGGPPRRVYMDVRVETKLDPLRNCNTYFPRFSELPTAPQTTVPNSMSTSAATTVLLAVSTDLAHAEKNGPTDGGKNGLIEGSIPHQEDGGRNGPVTSLIEPLKGTEAVSTSPASDWDARWRSVQDRVAHRLGRGLVTSWLMRAKIVDINDSDVVIQMQNEFARRKVEENTQLVDHLRAAWHAELGRPVAVRLVDAPRSPRKRAG